MKLKKLTYTGDFVQGVCGLVHPFRDEYAVGCGRRGKFEQFRYTLEDGHTLSVVLLCPACAAKQMSRKRVHVNTEDADYAFYANGERYAAAWRSEDGWACKVSIGGRSYNLWNYTLRDVEVDALAWYRFYTGRC